MVVLVGYPTHLHLNRIIHMSISDLIVILFAFAITQTIAYFSSKSVLGAEAGWKVNSLLGMACMVTIWGSAYAGLFAQSLLVWLAITAIGVAAIVYALRRRAQFHISVKQGLQIFLGVAARFLITAAFLGAVARGLMFVIKSTSTASGSN